MMRTSLFKMIALPSSGHYCSDTTRMWYTRRPTVTHTHMHFHTHRLQTCSQYIVSKWSATLVETLNNPSKSAHRCEERAQLFSSTVWALWAELIYCQSTAHHSKAQHILPAVITYVRLRLQQIMSSLLKDSEPLTPSVARGTGQLKRPQSQTQTLNEFIWMVIHFTNTAKEINGNVILVWQND